MGSGLGGLVVSALNFQAGYRGFESRSGQNNFQTISSPSSYSTCPGLSIKWTGRRLVTDSGTKCAWVIHESKAVQIHVHYNRRCLYVPRVPGSVKNPHNNNKYGDTFYCHHNALNTAGVKLNKMYKGCHLNKDHIKERKAEYRFNWASSSRKHPYIILTPLNPTFI